MATKTKFRYKNFEYYVSSLGFDGNGEEVYEVVCDGKRVCTAYTIAGAQAKFEALADKNGLEINKMEVRK